MYDSDKHTPVDNSWREEQWREKSSKWAWLPVSKWSSFTPISCDGVKQVGVPCEYEILTLRDAAILPKKKITLKNRQYETRRAHRQRIYLWRWKKSKQHSRRKTRGWGSGCGLMTRFFFKLFGFEVPFCILAHANKYQVSLSSENQISLYCWTACCSLPGVQVAWGRRKRETDEKHSI